MTAIELKEKIIAQVNSTNNEKLLEEISHLVDFELKADDVIK